MDLTAPLFPASWHWGMTLLSVIALWRAVRRAPWRSLLEPSSVRLNLAAGFAVGLMLLWSLRVGIEPVADLHMLGAMAATLALGPHLALFALGVTLTGVMLNGTGEWLAWPASFVLMVIVPVYVATLIQHAVERWLPAHLFIFIFAAAFLGAALTVMAQGISVSLVLMLSGAYSAGFLFGDYLPPFLLLGFAEAWISGAVITLMVVYRPGWVEAFDDRRYLLGK